MYRNWNKTWWWLPLAVLLIPALWARAAGAEATGSSVAAEPSSKDSSSANEGDDKGDDLSRELDRVLGSKERPSQTANAGTAGAGSLLNPDISVIFDGVAGAMSRPLRIESGDDPRFAGPLGHSTGGVTLQELEIGFQSVVDPYFTANAFLTIPNLDGIEVEEAYATTTALPLGFQIRAGVIRSSIGRQNEQHLHMQDFTRRPLLNAAYLGADGLRPPGVQLSWLAPTSFYLRLAAEVLSPEPGTSPTFGGALRSAPALVQNVKTFAPLGESLSLLAGLSVAEGHAPPVGFDPGTAPLDRNGPRTLLGGIDVYLKYSRPNHVEHYFTLAFQSEYFLRRTSASAGGLSPAQVDAGWYGQLVSQLSRRWYAGIRYDVLGLPASAIQPRVQRVSAMGEFAASEFSRVRLQLDREAPATGAAAAYEALLLLEYSIGAHGAHPY